MIRAFRFAAVFFSVVGMIIVLCYAEGIFVQKQYSFFEGKGTAESPYIIRNSNELKMLRDLVNGGEDFEKVYFFQSSDIELEGEEWIPIGIFGSGNYFAGIYDGGAHCIKNLHVAAGNPPSNGGLFGILNGTVKNLGIESGEIEGDFTGAIASHGTPQALILNCYNKASVQGTGRAGGICDNLSGGAVINCVNDGQVSAPVSAQIVSYDAGLLLLVCPEEGACTDYFTGIFPDWSVYGNSIQEQLNAGLDILTEEGVVTEEEVVRWK